MMRTHLILVIGFSIAVTSTKAVANETATDLVSVLKRAKEEATKSDLSTSIGHWVESASDSDIRRSTEIEVEFESKLRKEVDDGVNESSIASFVNLTTLIGRDQGAIRRSFRAEADRQVADATVIEQEQIIIAGEAYLTLRRHEAKHDVAKRLAKQLEPYITEADAAEKRGGADTLTLLKMRLLREKLTATRDEAARGYELLATALSNALKFSLSPVPGSPPLPEPKLGIPERRSSMGAPQVESYDASARAALAKMEATSAFELGGGIGVERDLTKKATTFVARVTIPMTQWSKQSAARREYEAERRIAEKQRETALLLFERRAEALRANASILEDRIDRLKQQRQVVADLHQRALIGLSKGFSGLADVIESGEALFDLELEFADAVHEKDTTLITLLVMTGGM